MSEILHPESLALWYFRLNGVFTIPNFVLHPYGHGSAHTDVDIAGVRFPYRREFDPGDGGDDRWFQELTAKPCCIIAEVKTAQCAINGPWSNRDRGNVNRIMADLGLYSPEEAPTAAEALYERGYYDGQSLFCSLFCVGNSKSERITDDYPHVPQQTWVDIADWLYRRFRKYRERKADHNQWDYVGKRIWTIAEEARNPTEFSEALRKAFSLPTV